MVPRQSEKRANKLQKGFTSELWKSQACISFSRVWGVRRGALFSAAAAAAQNIEWQWLLTFLFSLHFYQQDFKTWIPPPLNPRSPPSLFFRLYRLIFIAPISHLLCSWGSFKLKQQLKDWQLAEAIWCPRQTCNLNYPLLSEQKFPPLAGFTEIRLFLSFFFFRASLCR